MMTGFLKGGGQEEVEICVRRNKGESVIFAFRREHWQIEVDVVVGEGDLREEASGSPFKIQEATRQICSCRCGASQSLAKSNEDG